MSSLRSAYLAELGIPVWVSREVEQNLEIDPAADSTAEAAGGLDLDALALAVASCTRCPLHRTRQQTVFGVGNRHADLLVVGEAPGAEEDRQGEPFVGRAGQLLTAMLRAIGLSRETVYIANILKCRPPNNRDPRPEEATECTPYLRRQIELIRPRVLLALGRISGQWLTASELPVGRLRGQILITDSWNVPIVVSYHPAYLLRSPAAKAKAWEDLLLVKGLLEKTE